MYDNNVYVRTDFHDGNSNDLSLSIDGEPEVIYNAIPDWVYEEEILATNKAMYYSSDGKYVAYARFDDSDVEEFFWQTYGDPSKPLENRYPEEVRLKYPKAGTTNPTVEFFVSDLSQTGTVSRKPVIPPRKVTFQPEYLYSTASWTSDTSLSIIWMNRVQNYSVISECYQYPSNWSCNALYDIEEHNGWLDLFQPPSFDSTGDILLQVINKYYII